MNFIQRIQDLPVNKRKMILWAAVIVIGSVLILWWLKTFQEKIKNFNLEEIKNEVKNAKENIKEK